jgi:hypothetical protein
VKNISVIILSFFISACSNISVKDETDSNNTNTSQVEEAPISKRIYYFQHKLIPKWVFESDGEFYFDLYNRNVERLLDAAAEIISPEYAKEIKINPLVDQNAVSISFSEPDSMANCYFVLVQKTESGYSYYTYEKTFQFDNEDFVGVVGGWDSEGNHSNFGSRSYKTEQEFVADVLEAM